MHLNDLLQEKREDILRHNFWIIFGRKRSGSCKVNS